MAKKPTQSDRTRDVSYRDAYGAVQRDLARAALEIERLNAEIEAHRDDEAVRRFAGRMTTKMAASRGKGRSGWQTCPVDALWEMLRDHVEKGDPVDVANLCMMIHRNAEGK